MFMVQRITANEAIIYYYNVILNWVEPNQILYGCMELFFFILIFYIENGNSPNKRSSVER